MNNLTFLITNFNQIVTGMRKTIDDMKKIILKGKQVKRQKNRVNKIINVSTVLQDHLTKKSIHFFNEFDQDWINSVMFSHIDQAPHRVSR